MPLGDGSYGASINAFSDENFSPRGVVSIRMVFPDLDGNCPCTPIELAIRYYQGDTYHGQYYESQNVRAILTRLQRIDGDNFEVEGNFAGRFGFLQAAGGRVGRTVAGKGTFRTVVGRVRRRPRSAGHSGKTPDRASAKKYARSLQSDSSPRTILRYASCTNAVVSIVSVSAPRRR